jgi:hypothetical protein
MRLSPVLVFGLAMVAATAPAPAQHRHAGAHEHGRGTLNVAVEGKRVSMELEVPGADIVGFEHAAKTSQQKAAVEKGKQQLLAPQTLFQLPAAAGCAVSAANVAVDSGDGKGEHSEFHAQYTFDCQAPASLTSIDFDYFRTFSRAKRLDVSVVAPKGQSKFSVTRAKPRIDLGGMM